MQRNIGGFDRGLRIVSGLVLILLAIGGKAGEWAWLGFIPVVLGFVGWCPLFRLLGVDTSSIQYARETGDRAAV